MCLSESYTSGVILGIITCPQGRWHIGLSLDGLVLAGPWRQIVGICHLPDLLAPHRYSTNISNHENPLSHPPFLSTGKHPHIFSHCTSRCIQCYLASLLTNNRDTTSHIMATSNHSAISSSSVTSSPTPDTKDDFSDAASEASSNSSLGDTSDEVPPLYERGFELTAWQHDPPESFDHLYRTITDLKLEEYKHHLEHACAENSAETYTVLSTIRTGFYFGPQIILLKGCRVAKVYDWEYYDSKPDGYLRDTFRDAIGDWSREVAAYEILKEEAKDLVPQYFGSYTCQVGGIGSKKRIVPFIVIERVKGDCMFSVDAFHLHHEVRSIILKKVLEIEVELCRTKIMHGDFSPLNLIIQANGTKYKSTRPNIEKVKKKLRIKVINFAHATYLYHDNYRYIDIQKELRAARSAETKMINPFKRRFRRMADFSTSGWCYNNGDGAELWLWKKFGV
jgi:hypothetical protein